MQMTLFWIITVAMLLIALAILAPSLLGTRRSKQLDRDRQNVMIARERLAELEADLNSGRVTQVQYEQMKLELEQALLIDLEQQTEVATAQNTGAAGRLALGGIVLALPLFSLPLYFYLGSPELIQPGPLQTVQNENPHTEGRLPPVDQMVTALVERLQENPTDAEGWFLLGRTYMVMQDYPRAAATFEKLHQIVGDQPVVLLSWADAQSMAQSGSMQGKPTELVKKALELAPTNTTALWLAGMVEDQAGNHDAAIKLWERLTPLIQDDPRSRERVASLIANARAKGGLTAPVSQQGEIIASSDGIQVQVTLSPEFADKVTQDWSLFIYARAIEGPKMPLAAAKHKVSDLPLEITLDDSSAMMPELKLSNFEQVLVGARISSSGNPIAVSGDLKGEVSPVMVTSDDMVRLVIDRVVP